MKVKKLANDKYKITIGDENYKIHEQVIIDYNILYKKEIDENLLIQILEANLYYEKYDKALKYAIKKVRSESEIKKYLIKYECSAEEIKKIVSKLKSINLINEDIYIKSYIADKLNLTNEGIYKIKKDLIKKGMDEVKVNNYLKNFNESDRSNTVIRLINKKLRLNRKYSEHVIKQKIVNDLINLGYSKEFIEQCFSGIDFKNNNITKEADKLKLKLSKKWSDKELIYQLKNKLYQKGFKSEEIENYINSI